ncbi:MAG: type II secretion system minor pseudopilin GspK [Burkholderiales bacterium]|nr:type II secretion system minor pseudopilin GspK [Burkholderiales bacterium]
MDGGEISGYITDQQGLFNLNNLAINGKTDPAQLDNFRRLLILLQLNPDLAQAVADWIDADSEAQSPGGAENNYYIGLPDPYRAANMPLVVIEDLYDIAGFDEPTIEKLRPFVSVLPAFTQINVNTAPPEVLSAIVPGLTLNMAQQLVTSRTQNYFATTDDFASRIQAKNIVVPNGEITVASQFFLVTVKVTQGKTRVIMHTLLDREGSAWPSKVWQSS